MPGGRESQSLVGRQTRHAAAARARSCSSGDHQLEDGQPHLSSMALVPYKMPGRTRDTAPGRERRPAEGGPAEPAPAAGLEAISELIHSAATGSTGSGPLRVGSLRQPEMARQGRLQPGCQSRATTRGLPRLPLAHRPRGSFENRAPGRDARSLRLRPARVVRDGAEPCRAGQPLCQVARGTGRQLPSESDPYFPPLLGLEPPAASVMRVSSWPTT